MAPKSMPLSEEKTLRLIAPIVRFTPNGINQLLFFANISLRLASMRQHKNKNKNWKRREVEVEVEEETKIEMKVEERRREWREWKEQKKPPSEERINQTLSSVYERMQREQTRAR